MSTPRLGIPAQIETKRLVLRCWSPKDAEELKLAVTQSVEHLRPWLPWAWYEPSTLEQTRARLDGFATAFAEGTDFVFGIFGGTGDEVLGGIGAHPRIGPGGLEIGYWIRVDQVGRGYATEAAGALTKIALEAPDTDRVEIRCDPRNAASRRIPEKLGYRLVDRVHQAADTADGEARETVIYEVRP